MDLRSKTWIPVLAMALAGCGSRDEPTNSGGSTSPTGSTETAGSGVSVDLNDSRELDRLLQGSGIENPTIEGEATHRGAGEKFLTTVFPIFPNGKVRLEGLTSYRIDIDIESFEDGGSLEFHVGKKVLWKQGDVFAPKFRVLSASIPRTVLDGVKVGETVTWGVFFEDPKKKDIVAEFKVAQEDQLDRALLKLDKDKKVRSQSPLVRTLTKAKVLQNHSLLSEALSDYLSIVDTHPSITEAWKNIVDCMRRLDLKKTPLFEEALLQMSTGTGYHRPDDPFGGVTAPGGKRAETPIPPMKTPPSSDKPPANPNPLAGMNGEAPAGTPAGGDGQQTAAGALAKVTEFYNQAKGMADLAQAMADKAKQSAADANAVVAAAQRAVHKAQKDMKDAQGGTPAEQDAAKNALLAANKKFMDAQAAADAAADAAMIAAKNADGARYTADQADRVRQELARIASASGPMPMPTPGGASPDALLFAAQRARGVADLAAANAMAMRVAMLDAKDAYYKAKADAEAHPNNQHLKNVLGRADAAYQAAQAAAAAAKIAAEQAEFQAQQALEASKPH